MPLGDDEQALAAENPEPQEPNIPKPSFTFHTLLAAKEVTVAEEPVPARDKPEEETPAIAEAKQPTPEPPKPVSMAQSGAEVKRAVTPAPVREASTAAVAQASGLTNPPGTSQLSREATDISGQYMLQVGSFTELASADRLRASLMLSGYDALIQTVAVSGGHRHQIGRAHV